MRRTVDSLAKLLLAHVLVIFTASCGSSNNENVSASRGAETSELPNIIIFIADDLGWNDVGAYGNTDVYTPNIDMLSRQGVRFTNAFLTTSSCSSSRASILTGRYPQTTGAIHLHQPLPAGERPIAGYLRDAGYYTVSAGKWHLGKHPMDHFDEVIAKKDDPGTALWVETLRDRPRDKPFFFWFGSRDPHLPHDAGEDFERLYDEQAITLPRGIVDGEGVRRDWLKYLAEISRFDHDIGLVVDELRRQDILDNTLIIVMSDNGRPFHRAKTWIYDDGVRTPFIVHWPGGMHAPGDYEGLVSAVDIAPTLLQVAGLEPPEAIQGLSFAGVFGDRNLRIRNEIFAVANWHGRNIHERMVRTTEYLYKENQYPEQGDCVSGGFKGSNTFKAKRAAYLRGELDPVGATCFAEQRDMVELLRVSGTDLDFENLAEKPEYREVRDTMAEILRNWRDTTGDFDYEHYTRPE